MNIRTLGLSLLLPLAALPPLAAQPAFINTPFVVTNQTAYPPDQVWLNFEGTVVATSVNQTAGSGTFSSSAAWQSFSLQQLTSPVAGVAFFNGQQVPNFALNSFSGRVYVSYGAPLSSAPNPSSPGLVPYALVEMTVTGQFVPNVPNSSNIDLSYVDGVSMPVTTAIRNGTTGAALAATSINPVNTTPDILANVAALVPAGAVVRNGSTPVRVISSSQSAAYHDWSALMTTLKTQTATTPLVVASYTTPTLSTLAPYSLSNVLFGYSGAPAISGQYPGFATAQNYNMTAVFSNDLNPGGNQTLTNVGIPPQTPGVVIAGNATVSGNFSLYVTESALNSPTGIYGSNPGYAVVGPQASYQTGSIVNDLGGRIVGDLMAGMVFGWSASTVNIVNRAAATGTNLGGVTFSSSTVRGIGTGELFFLLSLAGAQSKLGEWLGGALTSNSSDYDIYTYAIALNSNAYGTGFGDRFQGSINPNTYWYTANPPTNPATSQPFETVGYVEIALLAPTPQPAVRIRGPKTVRTRAARVVLRGTASCVGGTLAAVEVKATGRGYRRAKGLERWNYPSAIRPGRNLFLVRAVARGGVSSRPERVVVIRRR